MAHVASAAGAGTASAAAAGSAASGGGAAESSAPVVVDRSSIEGIKARYRGRALVERLSYLGEVASASRASAMALAAAECKAVGSDTGLYASLCEAAGTDPDAEWIAATKERVSTRQASLERELNMKLAAQDREAIFVSLQDWNDALPRRAVTRTCRAAPSLYPWHTMRTCVRAHGHFAPPCRRKRTPPWQSISMTLVTPKAPSPRSCAPASTARPASWPPTPRMRPRLRWQEDRCQAWRGSSGQR